MLYQPGVNVPPTQTSSLDPSPQGGAKNSIGDSLSPLRGKGWGRGAQARCLLTRMVSGWVISSEATPYLTTRGVWCILALMLLIGCNADDRSCGESDPAVPSSFPPFQGVVTDVDGPIHPHEGRPYVRILVRTAGGRRLDLTIDRCSEVREGPTRSSFLHVRTGDSVQVRFQALSETDPPQGNADTLIILRRAFPG